MSPSTKIWFRCHFCGLLYNCTCNISYAGADGDKCVACALGSFQASQSDQDCTQCAAGSFTFAPAAHSCVTVTCPAVHFASKYVLNVERSCGPAKDAACLITMNSYEYENPPTRGNDGIIQIDNSVRSDTTLGSSGIEYEISKEHGKSSISCFTITRTFVVTMIFRTQ